MTDEVWKRNEVQSPCIKTCVIQPDSRLCIGCKRSIEEITGWSRMTPDDRAAIMADLPERRIAQKRRGGRSARLRDG